MCLAVDAGCLISESGRLMHYMQGTIVAPACVFESTLEWRETSGCRNVAEYVPIPSAFGYRVAKHQQGSPAGIQFGVLNTKDAPLGTGTR